MLVATAAHAALVALAVRRPRPLCAAGFSLPAPGAVDRRLLAGAALFGVGWGLGVDGLARVGRSRATTPPGGGGLRATRPPA